MVATTQRESVRDAPLTPPLARCHTDGALKVRSCNGTALCHTFTMIFMRVFMCSIWFVGAFSLEADVVVLRAVRGRDARLPCGQGKVFLDGPDSYVLWLKNDRDFLYRFPNENSGSRSLNQDRIFGTSCESGSCHDDTSLLLKRVSDQDAGIYRCRVHYQASPSQDYVIDVRLVESPGMPRVYSNSGVLIKQGYVGPLSLGSDLTLVCEVDDEQPDTLVYWRRNGVVIERAHEARPGVLRAEVLVRNATRSELDAHYECLAQNADVTEALTASVVIRMYCKFQCFFSWQLNFSNVLKRHDDTSVLALVKKLFLYESSACKNTLHDHSEELKTIVPPISVEIRLNHNFNFEAGQPRVVDCVVVGCVPPPSITWHLGDNLLRPSVHKELHDGNYTVSSLTLAPSLRDNKRKLVCRAHNSHLPDEVFEDDVTLNVGYRPLCLTSREETVGAVQREAETLTCIVEASPEPIQFSWTFADSKTLYTSVKKVPGHHHRYSSTLTWLPRDGDFGLLYCRATNSFGEQKKPCTYSITSGGPPQSPDCSILRSYPHTVRVECQKGWDGGRPQIIHLELFGSEGGLLHNVSNSAGHFHLSDMEEDNNLTAILYASNNRGRSSSKTMYLQAASTLNASAITEHPTVTLKGQWLQALAGLLTIIVIIAIVGVCLRMRCKHEDSESPDLVLRSDGVFHREPDFEREERLLRTTNITVNQLAACQNATDLNGNECPWDILIRTAFHDLPQGVYTEEQLFSHFTRARNGILQQYASSPVPSCRVLVGCGSRLPPQDTCPASQHSYFV
ncbi:Nephrin [Papilio machaon]|uniref:Nephrin n=1 Tax=Papilio machaon TaxID=76193 RepID=A0A194QUU8_PAPMA|nr:Nephrin [Papilio machaon]